MHDQFWNQLPLAVASLLPGLAPSQPAGLQQASRVIQGGRLDVPPAERLPGDTPTPEGLAAYTALLHGCWDQDPGNRPTFPHIVFDLRCVLCVLAAVSAKVVPVASPADTVAHTPPFCHCRQCMRWRDAVAGCANASLATLPGTALQEHAGLGINSGQQAAIPRPVSQNQHAPHAARHRLVPCMGAAAAWAPWPMKHAGVGHCASLIIDHPSTFDRTDKLYPPVPFLCSTGGAALR